MVSASVPAPDFMLILKIPEEVEDNSLSSVRAGTVRKHPQSSYGHGATVVARAEAKC